MTAVTDPVPGPVVLELTPQSITSEMKLPA